MLSTESDSRITQKLARRIPELDGLRGAAILLVLILHYVVEIAIVKTGWQFRCLFLFRLCWSGVDLFFVLSGFLIGGILLDAKHAKGYYRAFYARRLYRIVPIYAILIAVFIAGVYAVPKTTRPLAELFNDSLPVWSYPLFLQNIFMALRHNYGTGWMGATWSLAVEEQFYLLLPFAVRRLSGKGIVGLASGMILAAPILRMILERHGVDGLATYILLPCRSDAFGFGLLVALGFRNHAVCAWLESHREYLLAVFAFLGSGVLFWILFDVQLGYTWMAAFYTSVLVLTLVTPGGIVQLVFRSFVLTRLGTVAYAVFLFHPGILRLFHYAYFGAAPSIQNLPTFSVTLLSLGATLAVSAVSWRIIEKPLIQHARSRYQYGRT